jgi:hypothetical protein
VVRNQKYSIPRANDRRPKDADAGRSGAGFGAEVYAARKEVSFPAAQSGVRHTSLSHRCRMIGGTVPEVSS